MEAKAKQIIKSYLKIIKSSIAIYFYLYLWSLIAKLPALVTGKEKHFLQILLPFSLDQLVNLAIFTFFQYAILILIPELVQLYILMPLKQCDIGHYRRYPYASWEMQLVIAAVELIIPARYLCSLTGLKKTSFVITLLVVIIFLVKSYGIYNTRKEFGKIKSKISVAYITLYEWKHHISLYNIISSSFLEGLSFAKPAIHNSSLVYETDQGIICPYWTAVNLLRNESVANNLKLILYVDAAIVNELGEPQKREIYTIIDECIERKNKVLVVIVQELEDTVDSKAEHPENSKLNRFLHELGKRPVQFCSIKQDKKEDVMKDFILSDRKRPSYADKIIEMRNYLSKYEDNEKYRYLKEEIMKIHDSSDETDTFYRLIKLMEYMFHYRALALLSKEGANFLPGRHSFEASMGVWNDIQKHTDRIYRSDSIREAYKLIYKIMNHKDCGKMTIKYLDICDLVTQLRNRYVGHGTMAFSVSANLLDAVMAMILVIMEVYQTDSLELKEEDRIITEVSRHLDCYKNISNAMFLLSGFYVEEELVVEYIDYSSGRIFSGQTVRYDLSYYICEEGN